ncbi:S-adenosyl-L-methionine-dependent methyltransferase [Crucibulum laeve]|uniref:S-adenosyl-L-methionine-dependent methyltransferase n=1 Tax=Crucibulum laeve TaxID=68775 RepID=A0A5C3LFS6_9AGAR|nr:S-adenosyl-L-methionine-dependent methyltransferase [Crucibulum laeve]
MSHSHTHGPGEHHHGHSHHDYTNANQEHYDKTATEYDAIPGAVERSQRSVEALRDAYPFDKSSTTVMEFACGTGLVSKGLFPYVRSILGVDISQGMIDQYNKRVDAEGVPADSFHAIRAELKGEDGELDGKKFDVIICCSAYHHFSSVEEITRILVSFLKPGGTLLIIDHKPTSREEMESIWPGKFSDQVVALPGGFEEEVVQKLFEGAGLVDFVHKDVPSAKVIRDMELFVAKGVKPLTSGV